MPKKAKKRSGPAFGSPAWRAKYMHKSNTGHHKKAKRKNTGSHSHHKGVRVYRRNAGEGGPGSVGSIVTNATFVLVGALGSKLGAQVALGANNVGPLGYAGNLAAGGILWFLAEKVMKNRTAASGIIAGTVAQLILRLINDFTPFGSYLTTLGMGDYQMQSFVTPQILVDPFNSADIAIPPGWAPRTMLPAGSPAANGRGGGSMGNQPVATTTAAATGAPPSSGMGGLYDAAGPSLYGV